MTSVYVGIDIGGTNVRAIAFDDLNCTNILHKVSASHPTGKRSYEEDYKALVKTIRKVVGGKNVAGIGLGLPGTINADKTGTSVIWLPGWQNQPVAEHLSKEFDCPVKVDHDQVCSALGEAMYGNNNQDFALIGYGTGFGGAFAENNSNKAIVRAIQGTREYEYFDNWDQECGGYAIMQEFGKPASDFDETDWKVVMNRFKKHLKKYLSRPEIDANTIVFSGGVAVKQAKRLLVICNELKTEMPNTANINFKIVTQGEDSGSYGAVALLRNDCTVQ